MSMEGPRGLYNSRPQPNSDSDLRIKRMLHVVIFVDIGYRDPKLKHVSYTAFCLLSLGFSQK